MAQEGVVRLEICISEIKPSNTGVEQNRFAEPCLLPLTSHQKVDGELMLLT